VSGEGDTTDDRENDATVDADGDAETDLEVTGVRVSELSGVLVRDMTGDTENLGEDDGNFVVMGLGLAFGDAEILVEKLPYDADTLAEDVTLGDDEILIELHADPDTLAEIDALDETLGDASLDIDWRALGELALVRVAICVPDTVIVGDTV